MSALEIIQTKDTQNIPQILRKSTRRVLNWKSPEIKKLVRDMKETVERNKGVGLAASQIRQALRIIVVNLDKPLALINPEIIFKSKDKDSLEEGCLSLPDIFVKIKRPKEVKVKAILENGKEREFIAKGILARVIQHEVDHLDGKLIIDYQ